ncbi:MAG: N-acetylmuramoyl-L-alanine amidase [Bacteroidetes bacterium]|nr:N-acetylmuramoyl-L-alanine amidase [Bacteroidota bacterium]
MIFKILNLIILLHTFFQLAGQNYEYLRAEVQKGEGAYSLLERHGLDRSHSNLDRFKQINQLNDLNLYIGKRYKVPIRVYQYNATSIRTTIGNSDYDYAVAIQKYNELMHKLGVKEKDYREDNILWVPEHLPDKQNNESKEPNLAGSSIFPIFGKEYEKVDIQSTALTGHVYYIVAGHGGPDPGAMGNYNGHVLCEDEYAYDISLRLARNLLEQNATVYMINRDPNDGIRSGAYLEPDKDEVCYPEQVIPLNQIRRLNQRVDAINSLYNQHKKVGAKKQRAIIIHVDSRATGQRIDMFFYHNPKSKNGKKLAENLRNTIAQKYDQHQKGRGYNGTVKARNLHMLRETYPVAVYAELGNIRNYKDQKRFIIEDNRQAVANWLLEGIMKDD